MANKNFSKKLKDMRLKAGYSQKEVYEHFGIPQSTFSSWEVGKSEPPGDMLFKLCEFYKCDMIKDLSTDENDNVTYAEWKMIEKYRIISEYSPDGANVVDTVLDREYAIAEKLKGQSEQIQKMKMEVAEEIVPTRLWAYYGKIAAAGTSVEFSDMIAGTKEYPVTEMNQNADYVIGVNGDSMEPEYFDGDIVFVEKATHVNIGDVGIFQKDNNIYIKKAGENGLVSLKAGYPVITSEDGIRVWGKVLGKAE